VDGGDAQGTTTFTTVASATGYDRGDDVANPMNDSDLEVDEISSISDFLAKPINVATGTFSAANTWGSSIFHYNIYTLFQAQPMWVQKIQGYLNFRADVKFRLVINPTPFQAGLLRLSYFPCARNMPLSVISHHYNRDTKSQLPGSYLNLNDNFCEVTVPYIAPTSFIQRDSYSNPSFCDWGDIDIDVFEIYRTGTGPANVNWALWMSLENVQLSGMVQPQMAQKRRGRNIAMEANGGSGPVSRMMSTGKILTESLGKIPSLTPLVGPTLWAIDAVKGCAEALGWSKPTSSGAVSAFSRNLHAYNNNCDGDDNCLPLSLRTDNRIAVISDAAPGGLDEMSMNFIKRQWAYSRDFEWLSTRLPGDLLYSFQVSPQSLIVSSTHSGEQVLTCPPAVFPSLLYDNYRGGFEVKMRLVKTGFHTGTLAVTWTPGTKAVAPTYADTSYMYRQIIDIQEGNEFVFVLPYLVAQDFLCVREPLGILTVHCVNPLLAPATVASTIDVMFEVRGAADLVYSAPKEIRHAPFVPQAIDTEEKEGTRFEMASEVHGLDNVNHMQLAAGETQLSLLDFLKAQHLLRFTGEAPGWNSGRPYFLTTGQLYAGGTLDGENVKPALGGDPFSLIGSMYAFQRGSIRHRLMPRDCSATNMQYRALLINNQGENAPFFIAQQPPESASWWSSTLASNSLVPYYESPRVVSVPQNNGGLAIQVPFYSKYRYKLNELISWQPAAPTFNKGLAVAFTVPTSLGTYLTRAVGDDFQFSYFIGVPALSVSKWPNSA